MVHLIISICHLYSSKSHYPKENNLAKCLYIFSILTNWILIFWFVPTFSPYQGNRQYSEMHCQCRLDLE